MKIYFSNSKIIAVSLPGMKRRLSIFMPLFHLPVFWFGYFDGFKTLSSRGDIVLTTRGTIGNIAFYDNSIPYESMRINSGMVILRIHHKVLEEYFFIEQFKILLPSIKEKIASGSAQPQLPISTMNKIIILVPKIEEQLDFSGFVKQINKAKTAISRSLDKLETLKKALMQEYFE